MPRQLLARVTLSAIAFILVLTLTSLLDIANAAETRRLLGRLGDVVTPRLLESSEFDTHVTRTAHELQTYALAGDSGELVEAAVALDAARHDFATLTTLHSHADDADPIEGAYHDLNERRRALLVTLEQLLGAARGGSRRPALLRLEQIEGEIEALSIDSRLVLNQERARAADLAAERMRQNYQVIALGIGVPILASLLALAFIHRRIVQPIRELADATLAFAEGRLRAPVPVHGPYEITLLQRSFNTLVETIHQQTRELTAQVTVAEATRRQALAAQRLADELVERNGQIAAQSAALQLEISERELAELALIQARDAALAASRAKSTFLATMSHELRTPLTAILGYSQLLTQAAASGNFARVREDLGYINAAGQHLLTLINDVLDLSRIEAGRLPIACASFDVADLVQQIAATARPLAERAGNRFSVVCPPEIGAMESDATRVRQALLNLLSNAGKFTEDGSVTMSVEAAERDGTPLIRFVVTDTGIGIHADQLSRLFQNFTQLDDSPTRRNGGAGLGLALSQRLAHALGGAISVRSSLGQGSTFTLELPRVCVPPPADEPAPAAALAPAGAARPQAADGGDPTVCDTIALCIDDDPAVASLLTQELRRANTAVVYAASGQAGLELARDLQPDLILLAVRLPDMDGRAALALLRADAELAATPVILLGGDGRQPAEPPAGADGQLPKPIEPQRLLALAGRLLDADRPRAAEPSHA